MFFHFGFEKPILEIMQKWQVWFKSIADKQAGQGIRMFQVSGFTSCDGTACQVGSGPVDLTVITV